MKRGQIPPKQAVRIIGNSIPEVNIVPERKIVINESGHIVAVPPRRENPATQPIHALTTPVIEHPEPYRFTGGGFEIVVYPGDAVIITARGELTALVRSGASLPLGETQAVIRLNPASAHSKGTDLLG